MKEEETEKEEKERKEIEIRGQVQAIEEEEEEHGVDMGEARLEIRMRETITKEEIEADIEEEEGVTSEGATEEADEGVVGRIPAPPKTLFTMTCRKSMETSGKRVERIICK